MRSSDLSKRDELGYRHHYKNDSWVSKLTIFSLAIGLLGLFAWAYHFDLLDITRGQGQFTIPMSKVQTVQSLDAGILNDLNIIESHAVRSGHDKP